MSRIRPTHTLFPYTTLFRSHLQAVDAGEHDVEDDDVGLEALRRGHARGAVRGDLHAPALGREAVGDLGGDVRLVLDDERPGDLAGSMTGRCHGCTLAHRGATATLPARAPGIVPPSCPTLILVEWMPHPAPRWCRSPTQTPQVRRARRRSPHPRVTPTPSPGV